MKVFSKSDIREIQSRGISIEEIEDQISNFISGFPFIKLIKPAVPGDGIVVLSAEEIKDYCSVYEQQSRRFSVIKFVPASGAASRMFKNLFSFLEQYTGSEEEKDALLHSKDPNSTGYCIQHIDRFAFYHDLSTHLRKDGLDIDTILKQKEFDLLISYIIFPMGLNYGNLPKGLLKFHNYPEGARTAFEEHLVEAAMYARNTKDRASVHFTLSPEHITPFLALMEEKQKYYGEKFGITYDITYSVQKPSTDTLAVDHDNQPFRDENKHLVFRPGGHGALIDNLNELKHDIIFIKNIDNIVPDKLKEPTYEYKKALGGLLISLKQQIDSYLDLIEEGLKETDLDEVVSFCRKDLMIQLPDNYADETFTGKKYILYHLLNRPVRICGMVKNQGEPGGGPFWVSNRSGDVSLQIVESSQVDLNDAKQKHIFSGSTHFNPVDLVCHIKDHRGNKFDLKHCIDKSTGFISVKSKDGRDLKAQELPGLWNGAMADWISIFVEVPLITFNPVKVINDLLRETHQ